MEEDLGGSGVILMAVAIHQVTMEAPQEGVVRKNPMNLLLAVALVQLAGKNQPLLKIEWRD
jgi:hypothetical protein